MTILRNILAILAGYVIFVISAVLLFQLSGIDPHVDPSMGFIILSIIYGVVFSFIGGWIAELISNSGKLTINYILAGIIAGFAAFSMFKTSGNHYSQIAAIVAFAPASIVGGIVSLKRMRK
ncbi:hypothetical protein BH09BAC3_BH09BAC3_09250 [soil metagenome]